MIDSVDYYDEDTYKIKEYDPLTLPEGHGEFSIVKMNQYEEGEDFDFSTAKE